MFREGTGTTIGTTQQGLLSEDRSVRPAKTSGYRTKQQSNHARPETRLSQRPQRVPRNAMEGVGWNGRVPTTRIGRATRNTDTQVPQNT